MQNHQNPREYGISRHDQFPTSSRRDERWTGGAEWSARDETWRGSSRPPERREESWKGGSDFRLGRDRAPFPVDDQFLVRFGAKRLNNGSLVDRDGFTLRQRDPGCRAPSPPNFNPGREFRREERLPDSFRARDYSEQLRFDAPPPFRGPEPRPPPRNGPVHLPERPRHEPRRFERPRHEFRRPDPPRRHSPPRKSKPPVQEPKEPAKVDEDLEKKARQQIEMMKKMEAEEEKKKPKIGEKDEEEPEGEDEYEEVPPEPTPPSASVLAAQHLNNIKKPLLPLPTQPKTNIKKALIPQTPPIPPKNPREESWFNQYKKHVEELREKVYGTYEPAPVSSTSSYFFQSTPSASTSFATSSTSPFYSNPGWEAPPTTVPPKPPQMDLPPPGIVKMEPMAPTSSYSDAFGIRSSQKQIPPPPDSSDSEDEDIAKLKEIIKNCGRSSSSNY